MSVNPAVGISTSGFSQAGSWVASFKHNGNAGEVRIYGDYQVAGSTFTVSYASETYVGAGDADQAKKVWFGPSNPVYNNGRSKIEIGPGAGFIAKGQDAAHNPTLIDMLPAS